MPISLQRKNRGSQRGRQALKHGAQRDGDEAADTAPVATAVEAAEEEEEDDEGGPKTNMDAQCCNGEGVSGRVDSVAVKMYLVGLIVWQ